MFLQPGDILGHVAEPTRRIQEEMRLYGEVIQKLSQSLPRQERSLFGLTKPNIPRSFLPLPEKKNNLLSDILETGNEKDSSLTGICKLHQLFLSIQLYLAKIARGKNL